MKNKLFPTEVTIVYLNGIKKAYGGTEKTKVHPSCLIRASQLFLLDIVSMQFGVTFTCSLNQVTQAAYLCCML